MSDAKNEVKNERENNAGFTLFFGVVVSGLVLLSVLIPPVVGVWIVPPFFALPFFGIGTGIGVIKSKVAKTDKIKAVCGILLCVLPFVCLIPFQIKDDDFISMFEFEEMEDFQFYNWGFDYYGNEDLQLNHRLFIYSGDSEYVPHRDGCENHDCEEFVVDKGNKLYDSIYSTDPVTIRKRAGEKVLLLEYTRTKKCFIFGLYCPKEDGDSYDWTYRATLYIPETIQVKIYPNACTDEDRNEYGYIDEDKKECAMNENNYTFENAYEHYK